MKKILMNVVDLKESKNLLAQTLKLFVLKHSDYFFELIGPKKNFLSLTSNKNIAIIDVDEKDFQDEHEVLDFSFKILTEEKEAIDYLFTFQDKNLVLLKASTFLKPVSPIDFITLFPNPKTGRKFILVQSLSEKPLDVSNFQEFLKSSKVFAFALNIENPTFALLSSGHKDNKVYEETDKIFKKEKGYLGMKTYGDILDLQCDILLLDWKEFQIFMDGMTAGEKLLQNYIEVESIDSSFKFKLGSLLMSGIFDNYKTYRERNSSLGISLLSGYDKGILISQGKLKEKELTQALEAISELLR